MTHPQQVHGVGARDDDATQTYSRRDLDAAREAARALTPKRKVNLARFEQFGERGTPAGMIASDNATSLMLSGSCGVDEAVPVVRTDHRSSRSLRATKMSAAKLERRVTCQTPTLPPADSAAFEQRMTRQMSAVLDPESPAFEQRMTRQMSAVSDPEAPAFEQRMTRQMSALSDPESPAFEQRMTRQMSALSDPESPAFEQRMTRQVSAVSDPESPAFEQRMTRQMSAASDPEAPAFEQRTTRQVSAVLDPESPAFEQRMTRQVSAVLDPESPAFEQRMTRQMPCLPSAEAQAQEPPATDQAPAARTPAPADDDASSDLLGAAHWGPRATGVLSSGSIAARQGATPPSHANSSSAPAAWSRPESPPRPATPPAETSLPELDSSPSRPLVAEVSPAHESGSDWVPKLSAAATGASPLPALDLDQPETVPAPLLSGRRGWVLALATLVWLAIAGGVALLFLTPGGESPAASAPLELEGPDSAPTPAPAPAPWPMPAPSPASPSDELAPESNLEVLEEIAAPPPRVTEPGPVKKSPAKRRKSRPHASELCADTREATERAATQRDWQQVEVLTRKPTCWSSPTVADRYRIEALFELEQFEGCLTIGAQSKDPRIKQVRTLCATHL